jgi:hypothetical protein
MSNSIFDLEQQMLQFANITDDIELVTRYLIDSSGGYSDDDVMNKYFAIKELYELKFEKMWSTFEEVCKEYHIARKMAGADRDAQLSELFE